MDHNYRCSLQILIITSLLLAVVAAQLLTTKEHRTTGATQRVNDLWCYQCDSMEDGDRCVDLAGNHSSLMKKCGHEKHICMVKRFSHTMTTENSTTVLQMWSLERNCTKHCEPGCIVIGERTKLFACTSCCETSLCNLGAGASSLQTPNWTISIVISITILYLYVNNKNISLDT